MVPEIWCASDGWTEGQTEKVTYRGGPPKNNEFLLPNSQIMPFAFCEQ